MPKLLTNKKRNASPTKLKKKLDTIFSIYIRKQAADRNGYLHCYTCDKHLHWQDCHAGHFVTRNHLATRYDERNVRPQCTGCNLWGRGKPMEFGLRLESELGAGIIAVLYTKGSQIIKPFPYIDLIKEYSDKVQHLSTQHDDLSLAHPQV